jgi:hypothetical protein
VDLSCGLLGMLPLLLPPSLLWSTHISRDTHNQSHEATAELERLLFACPYWLHHVTSSLFSAISKAYTGQSLAPCASATKYFWPNNCKAAQSEHQKSQFQVFASTWQHKFTAATEPLRYGSYGITRMKRCTHTHNYQHVHFALWIRMR